MSLYICILVRAGVPQEAAQLHITKLSNGQNDVSGTLAGCLDLAEHGGGVARDAAAVQQPADEAAEQEELEGGAHGGGQHAIMYACLPHAACPRTDTRSALGHLRDACRPHATCHVKYMYCLHAVAFCILA